MIEFHKGFTIERAFSMKKFNTLLILIISMLVLYDQSVMGENSIRFTGNIDPDYLQQSSDLIIDTIVNQVSKDSIKSTIEHLQGFGTRYVYTDSCEMAAEYLYNRFNELGLDVEYSSFGGERLNDICFDSTGKIGWACGDVGVILKTTDGGEQWESFDLGIKVNLNGIHAVDENNVWIVGVGLALHTTDGGENWDALKKAHFVLTQWEDVLFFDALHGWIVSQPGETVLYTSDGGESWRKHDFGLFTFQKYSDIGFIDQINGWIATLGGVIRTTNGGTDWQVILAEEGNYFYGVHFINANIGWIVGANGRIYRSNDGGLHWSHQITGIQNELYAVYFKNQNVGWAVGQLGMILYTTNGGKDWHIVDGITTGDLCEIVFIDSDKGWIVGDGETIVYTGDGGKNWRKKTIETRLSLWHNVTARIEGTGSSPGKYILCGHYDSIAHTKDRWAAYDGSQQGNPYFPAPGANDNASGISVVLEAARILKDYELEHTVEFVCFTAEEIGLIGSLHYVYDQSRQGIEIDGAFNFDMLGNNSGDEVLGVAYWSQSAGSANLVDLYFRQYTNLNPVLHEVLYEDETWSTDAESFYIFGYPVVSFGQGHRDPDYHSPSDTLENLDLDYISNIVKVGTATVAKSAGVDFKHDSGALPENLELSQNFPNPFNNVTGISFVVPNRSFIRIDIYNVRGELVSTLVDSEVSGGTYHVFWDGKNQDNIQLPSGIYFYRLTAGPGTLTKRLVLLR